MTKLSAVTPMATMAPAMPGRLSAKPTELPSTTMQAYVTTAAMASEATTTRPRPREEKKQYRSTSARPMMPAMMPACSWSPPRVADTLLTSEMSKASGSAPYFRTLARSVAVCWVKLPEIWAAPPGIAVLTEGAEIDLPSRTIANRFIGSVLVASARVAFSNWVEPSALNCRLTTHSIPFCGMPALALVSWLPSMRVGPSRYFSVPVRSQENSGWSETSTWGSPHVKLAKSDWSDWLGCQSMALSAGVPWPTSVGRGAVGVGGAVGSWGATIGRLLPTEASPLPPLPAVVGS